MPSGDTNALGLTMSFLLTNDVCKQR